jgi:hypothetical protein
VNSNNSTIGGFQIQPCGTDGENVIMHNGAFYFKTSSIQVNWFWFEYAETDLEFYKGNRSSVLNNTIYSTVRQQIIDKLGVRAKLFVLDLDIGNIGA